MEHTFTSFESLQLVQVHRRGLTVYMSVHSSVIHSSQRTGNCTPLSINLQLDKQNLDEPYALLSSYKKNELLPHARSAMRNLRYIMLSEKVQKLTNYMKTRVGKSCSDRRFVVAWDGGRGLGRDFRSTHEDPFGDGEVF